MKHLLVVGVLLLTSVVPLYAEPVNVPPVNWLSPSLVAAPASRNVIVLPTRVMEVPEAVPRLILTQDAIREMAPVRMPNAVRQDQTAPKPQRSWFRRHWAWIVVPVVVVVVGVAVCAPACGN